MTTIMACAALLAGLIVSTTSAASAATTSVPDTWSSEVAGTGGAATNEGEHVITAASAGKLTPRWTVHPSSGFTAPAIVNGVVYHVADPDNLGDHGTLVASSATTGATEWSATLPAMSQHLRGQSVVGNLVLIPFDGVHQLAGITAVSIATHKVVWTRNRPASITDPGNDDGTGGPIVADASRVILMAGNNDLSAYAVSTGDLLWHRDPTAYFSGGSMYNGVFYTTTSTQGFTAYNASTGAIKWTATIGSGSPVVAGYRVIVSTGTGLAAYWVGGCGHPTCPPLWTTRIGAPEYIRLGGADSKAVFASSDDGAGGAARMQRFAAATGALQWTVALPPGPGAPVRVADTVWLISGAQFLVGWSVKATGTAPLRSISEAATPVGVVQGIAAADGTLAVSEWPSAIVGYRVTGT